MTGTSTHVDDTLEPPPSTNRVLVIGLVGVALVLLAFLIGLVGGAPLRGFDKHWADGPRASLCVLGLLTAGCAVSMHPRWFGGWLCGAAAGLLGYGVGGSPPAGTEWFMAPPRNWYAAVPNSWDSIQLFFGVLGGIGLAGAIWTRLPRKVVLCLILVGVAYHFSAILTMMTSPPPTPWLTMHYSSRIVNRYTQFVYFTNAYQFYSPDPGPACELWICIEYRSLKPGESVGDPVEPTEFKDLQSGVELDDKVDCKWLYIPKRETNYLDPLGLSFYRRMSITENVAHVQQPGYAASLEQDKVLARRRAASEIPHTFKNDPNWVNMEHRVPVDFVSRHVLPSYARHLAAANTQPEKQVKSVRIYRALHMITTLQQFRGFDPSTGKDVQPMSPYHPTLYLPYFEGRFSRDGRLVDSTDQMLYWLVPIMEKRPYPGTLEEYRRNGGYPFYFTDYVAIHAGCDRPIKE